VLHYCYILLTALLASLAMVPFLRKWAVSTGALDKPNQRKVHISAIPRLGGVAIFMAILFSTLVFVELGREMRGILAGGLILFFTGLIDDLHGISPKRKFVGEIVACLTAMGIGDFYITQLGDLFGFGVIVLPMWLAVPFTLFALVGVLNAVNLIDGLDGLAGGISVISFSGFFILGFLDGNHLAMTVSAAALGAILGFLRYNFYPARIFMGDGGSLVLGFLLAFTAIALTQGPGAATHPAIPLMILGLPIADTLFVMGRRILQGHSPFAADMGHLHHKFLQLGLHHRRTVLLLYCVSLFCTAFSIIFRALPASQLMASFVLVTTVSYIGLFLLQHRGGKDKASLRQMSVRPVSQRAPVPGGLSERPSLDSVPSPPKDKFAA